MDIEKLKTYGNLHDALALKYGTLPRIIQTLRSQFLGFHFSRKRITNYYLKKVEHCKKMLDILEKKLQKPMLSPKKKIQKDVERKIYMDAINANRWILNFVIARTEEEWNDIMQKTKFDK